MTSRARWKVPPRSSARSLAITSSSTCRLGMSADKKSGGLAGIVAGQTAISTVGKEGVGLTYRGYAIEELAEKSTFEEVAFLLLYGHLPNRSEVEAYKRKLIGLRGLPAGLKT